MIFILQTSLYINIFVCQSTKIHEKTSTFWTVFAKIQETLANCLNPAFTRVSFTYLIRQKCILLSHLCCNFCCKVINFLFHTFAYFETNYVLDYKSAVYRFKICSNGLFSIFCSYISLI